MAHVIAESISMQSEQVYRLEKNLSEFLFYHRWWGRRSCPDYAKSSADETSELQIENVAGVFFILVGGIAVAAVVCLAEYFAKQISKNIKKVSAKLESKRVSHIIIT